MFPRVTAVDVLASHVVVPFVCKGRSYHGNIHNKLPTDTLHGCTHVYLTYWGIGLHKMNAISRMLQSGHYKLDAVKWTLQSL